MTYTGQHGTQPYSFPNIKPMIEAALSIGFEIIEDHYSSTILKKMCGETPCIILIEHETASWDISDNTYLKFCFGELPPLKDRHMMRGTKYFGTQMYPTDDELREIIKDGIRDIRDNREQALRAAFAAYQEMENLKWVE